MILCGCDGQCTLWCDAPGVCKIDGCNKLQNSRGWCQMHYHRWRRNGDPHNRGQKGRKRIDTPVYNTVHTRVRRTRGPASDYPCADCGEPAEHWSYDNADPNELVGPTTRDGFVCRYSTDPNHYQPMCRTCHRWNDAKAAKERRSAMAGMNDTPDTGA